MMQIIVVNQSHKKALKQTAHILDAFLYRIGKNTWSGMMSQESLSIIVNEIKELKSKNTSIQVFWQHAHRLEQIIDIGVAKNGLTEIGKAKSINIKRPNKFVSELMLAAELAGLWHDYGKVDSEFQTMIRSKDRIKSNTHHSLISYFAFKAKFNSKLDYACSDDGQYDSNTLFGTVAKAILTHHHKPSSGSDGYLFQSSDKFGANIDQSSQLIQTISSELNAQSARLIARISKKDYELDSPKLAFYATRLALMMSDHATSKHEMTSDYASEFLIDTEPSDNELYAKSAKLIPLERHLMHVASGAKAAIRSIFMHQYPAVLRLPKIHDNKPSGVFAWQQKSVDAILSSNMKKEDGFFGVVIGETGSGKTQGGYLVMSALRNHNPRFTLGLGYGALAVQSGKEYQQEIGLNDHELDIFVGSKHMKRNEITGNDDEEFEIEGAYSYQSLDNGLSPIVEKLFTKQDLSLITVPVAVMTIDHIMSAITASRGAYVKSALRIATSDLLIDEIDSFSAQDCHAIARLCYLTGLFGKRVVVASATLPPELSSMLFDAYQAGYLDYSRSFGGVLYVGSFSNDLAPIVKIADSSLSSFCFFNDYTKAIQDQLIAKEHRNKIATLELLPCPKDDLSGLFSDIVSHAVNQADIHHSQIPVTFSTGLVRLNFIKDAQALFLYVIENADRIKNETGWTIKTNFYSGKMDFLSRKKLEQKLGMLLNRKNSDWMFMPEVQFLTEKTLFLLISTPVIEVGRDYDFDFALIEPSSYMSLIQTAGRVLRHRRDHFVSDPNVFMMSDSIRGLTSDLTEKKCRFGLNGPGFQQKSPVDNGLNISNREISSVSATSLFGLEFFDKGIHAGYRLHTGDINVFADRADKDMINIFHNGYDLSIASFINDDASLIVRNTYDNVQFRANDEDKDDKLFNIEDGRMILCSGDPVVLPYATRQIDETHCFIKLPFSKSKIEMKCTSSDIIYCQYLGILR